MEFMLILVQQLHFVPTVEYINIKCLHIHTRIKSVFKHYPGNT